MINVTKREKEQLFSLWETAFGDKEEYLEYFFAHFSSAGEVVMQKEEDQIIAALYLLPQTLKNGMESCKVMYLYAAATMPSKQGQGYMSQLIHQAEAVSSTKGADFLITLPASERLYDYYARFGMVHAFTHDEIKGWPVGQAQIGKREKLSYSHYKQAMKKVAKAIVRSPKTWLVATENFLAAGAEEVVFFTEWGEEYAIYQMEDEQVILRDGVLSEEGLSAFCGWIKEKQPMMKEITGFCAFLGKTPQGITVKQMRYGVAKPLKEGLDEKLIGIYMNAMME